MLSSLCFSQILDITKGINSYSLNNFNEYIYYEERLTGHQKKINFKTNISEDSEIDGFPEFANKNYQAAYIKQGNIYLYDFAGDSSILLLSISSLKKINKDNQQSILSFSPNDKYLCIQDDQSYIISFLDTNIISFTVPLGTNSIEWTSDTTFIFIDDENKISEYNLISENITNLIEISNSPISSIAYNDSVKLLAYATVYPAELHLFYLNTKTDTIIFTKSEYCDTGPFAIEYLSWNPEKSKLGFLVQGLTNSFSGISYYDFDSLSVVNLVNCFNGGYLGLKYFLQWYNDNNMIFVRFNDETAENDLCYINVDGIVNVKSENHIINNSLIYTYPNPFNSQIIFEYSVIARSEISLRLFDLTGSEIECLRDAIDEPGTYKVLFNAKELSSGIYFYVFQNNGRKQCGKVLFIK